MKHESVSLMFKRFYDDKKNGVERSPLHTLQECCEAAGIDPRVFGRLAAKHPDAPQPIVKTTKTAWRGQKLYYNKSKFVQWVNQVQQQKEKAMPDIKTALEEALKKTNKQLSETLNEWAADDEAHKKIQPQQEKAMTETTQAPETQDKRITTNVSRETFYFVRDNPGLTRDEIVLRMVAKGFKSTSVVSLLGQMLRGRIVMEDAAGKWSSVVREYVPVQSVQTKKIAGKAAPTSAPAPAPAPAPTQARKKVVLVSRETGKVLNPQINPPTMLPPLSTLPNLPTAESVLANMSVAEAHKLYTQLRAMFGA